MSDQQPNLLPPTTGTFTPTTPSGLTPNTRSEAEAALWRNSLSQTDSAAPTTPPACEPANMSLNPGAATGSSAGLLGGASGGSLGEAYIHRRRPQGASSDNYANALHDVRNQSTADSGLSTGTTESAGARDTGVSTPTQAMPFPPPGQGVVPLHTGAGVGTGQAEAVRRAKPSGMKLGDLGRQPSWSQQDYKHIYSAPLMNPPKNDDAGYSSGMEGKGAGGGGD